MVLTVVVVAGARLGGARAMLARGLGLLDARSRNGMAGAVKGCTGAEGSKGVTLVTAWSLVGWGFPLSCYLRDVGRGWFMEWEQGLGGLIQVLDNCLK
jgi:hypothetical protein